MRAVLPHMFEPGCDDAAYKRECQVTRLKELKQGNGKLKRLVASLLLDTQVLDNNLLELDQ